MRDYYAILGVPSGADQAAIRSAYHAQARKFHPDVSGQSQTTDDRIVLINKAYEILGNPRLREIYDDGRAQARGRRATLSRRMMAMSLLGTVAAVASVFAVYDWRLQPKQEEDPPATSVLSARHAANASEKIAAATPEPTGSTIAQLSKPIVSADDRNAAPASNSRPAQTATAKPGPADDVVRNAAKEDPLLTMLRQSITDSDGLPKKSKISFVQDVPPEPKGSEKKPTPPARQENEIPEKPKASAAKVDVAPPKPKGQSSDRPRTIKSARKAERRTIKQQRRTTARTRYEKRYGPVYDGRGEGWASDHYVWRRVARTWSPRYRVRTTYMAVPSDLADCNAFELRAVHNDIRVHALRAHFSDGSSHTLPFHGVLEEGFATPAFQPCRYSAHLRRLAVTHQSTFNLDDSGWLEVWALRSNRK